MKLEPLKYESGGLTTQPSVQSTIFEKTSNCFCLYWSARIWN